MSAIEDETYELYKNSVNDPPYQWEDGSTVDPRDHALYFLLLLFSHTVEDQKVDFVPLFRLDQAGSIDEAVVESLTGRSQEYRDQVERMARDTPKVGVLAGETLRPNFWPVVLRGLPNPSGIAWAYSPKRNDYAGAVFIPAQPKRFRHKGHAAGTLRLGLQSDFRKVMMELAPH